MGVSVADRGDERMDRVGQLVLAATPMGNSGDASARLRAALAAADIIAAEDTRRFRTLTRALEIQPAGRVVSFYDHVEATRVPLLVAAIEAGQTVLVVTDAGMPSVSDPGYALVAACVAASLPVTCLPGPSAVTTALALSGLPVDRFCFDGFAPRKSGPRQQWLRTLRTEPRACVFFESPHRIADCLTDAVTILGSQRPGAVCRELTKTYEEVIRGPLSELAEWAQTGLRGEITVVLAGAEPDPKNPADLVADVQARMTEGLRLKEATAEIAAATGVSRRALYQAVLAARDRT